METLTSDILGIMMMATDDETGQGLTNEELKNETMTIMSAGHEVINPLHLDWIKFCLNWFSTL